MIVKFKSQIEFVLIISITGILGLFLNLLLSISASVILKTALSMLIFMALYLILYQQLYKYFFYEDEIILFRYLSFKHRKETILFKSIKKVVYQNMTGYSLPTIILIYDKHKFSRFFNQFNQFTHRSFNKRKQILLFLHSKGIPVYVDSLLKKDAQIFKGLDNVTFRDDYWIRNG